MCRRCPHPHAHSLACPRQVTIDGYQAIPALAEWRAGEASTNLWLQIPSGAFPCPECCAGGPPPPAAATLALLTEAAAADGAVFLDGSPAARYIVRGAEANKWIIYQQGGGWCSSDVECLSRAATSIGSSKGYPNVSSTVMQEQAYLSNDPEVNPVFHNWTKVYLPYGDGSSQTSDVSAPVSVGGGTVYYRGARVLRAVIAFLRAEGLADASDVVIAGCSAGGLSTYLHADKWRQALPAATVHALPDSGFFLNWPLSNSSAPPANSTYPWRVWWMWSRMNVSAALAPACLAAHAPADAWLCLFAENVAPTLATPTFALQSVHDSYQIPAILHANASDAADVGAINAYGVELAARLQRALIDAPGGAHGAALDACLHHCGSRAWKDIGFPQAPSQAGAFAEWRAGGATRLFKQTEAFPCAACCGAGARL